MAVENSISLASKSPRRRELLRQIGVRFSVVDVDVLEQHQPEESAKEYVQRLSLSKARAGSKLVSTPVLGADTIVVLKQSILEKPKTQEQGIEMLMTLSSQVHHVYTSISLSQQLSSGGSRAESVLCRSNVTFRHISEEEALRYWRTGEPQDKAGGYGIQGYGAVFVENLEGSYSNVVGLPLMETQKLLHEFGVRVWQGGNAE